jgi:hypothetical protein
MSKGWYICTKPRCINHRIFYNSLFFTHFLHYLDKACLVTSISHFISAAQQTNLVLSRLIVELSISHPIRNTHPAGLAEAATYTTQIKRKRRTSMHPRDSNS